MGLTDSGQKSSAEDHARRVRAMFARISPRYDLLNHLLSANVDKRWRRRAVNKAMPAAATSAKVLDVGCGTGDLSIELFENTAAEVIGLDFCRPMLELARQKASQIPFIEGDGLRLPFPEATFDVVTAGFALRNLANVEEGLQEFRRVLKPGGMVVILEFSQPTVPGVRQFVRFYYSRLLPAIGGWFSGSRKAYEYLPNSIKKFPNQEQLAGMMHATGYTEIEFENLSGGIAAVHSGRRA
jgi:demethylmenaquinone methyltransferase / 2-methoxy-6-polyprenyl-1,4-benzoquinol methylase